MDTDNAVNLEIHEEQSSYDLILGRTRRWSRRLWMITAARSIFLKMDKIAMVSGRQLRRGFSEKIKIKHYSLRNIEFRILQPQVGVRDSVSCQGLKSCEETHSCIGGSMESPSDFSGAS